MDETLLVVTGLVCTTVLLTVIVVVYGWIKKEQQRTLRALLEHDKAGPDELRRFLSPVPQHKRDLRRGLLLVGFGLTIGVVFLFMGGVGWMFASIPIAVGLVHLLLWYSHARRS